MKLKASDIKLRPMGEQDVNFVLSSWLKSYKTSEFAKNIPPAVYYAHHQELVAQILKHERNHVSILCPSDDESQILGFIAFNLDLPIVYYTYVKHAFRKFGLGGFMFKAVLASFKQEPGATVLVTHKPKNWTLAARQFKLIYNPYVVSGS